MQAFPKAQYHAGFSKAQYHAGFSKSTVSCTSWEDDVILSGASPVTKVSSPPNVKVTHKIKTHRPT
jgi:hypothetical protein